MYEYIRVMYANLRVHTIWPDFVQVLRIQDGDRDLCADWILAQRMSLRRTRGTTAQHCSYEYVRVRMIWPDFVQVGRILAVDHDLCADWVLQHHLVHAFTSH
jgi:hypothetical protein